MSTPFNDAMFVVAWTGESPDSQILQGFDAVCMSISEDTGLSLEDVRKSLADPRDWIHAIPDGGADPRHIFYCSEYVYLCSLTIIRILRPHLNACQPPPIGTGDPVIPSLRDALTHQPELDEAVVLRAAHGVAKYKQELRAFNCCDSLQYVQQNGTDWLIYAWKAKMEGRDITHALDQMARAISVLQGGKP